MAKRNVILELRHNQDLEAAVLAAEAGGDTELDTDAAPSIPGVKFDTSFPATSLPGRAPRANPGVVRGVLVGALEG